jgi:twitching motility protein PilT
MIGTARVKDCIDDKDKTKQIPDAIAQGFTTYGMQTFDQSLMQLYSSRLISYEEALRQSTNPDDFALKVSGISSTSNSTWDQFTAEATEEEPAESSDGDAPKIERF